MCAATSVDTPRYLYGVYYDSEPPKECKYFKTLVFSDDDDPKKTLKKTVSSVCIIFIKMST